MPYTPAQIRKTILAALGVVAQVLAVALALGGVIPLPFLPYANVIIGVAQVYGVFKARNAPVVIHAEPRP